SRGHKDIVKTLVTKGRADINHETSSGKTPLIEAVRHARLSVVKLLVMELKAIVSYKNRKGHDATWWAKRLQHNDCLQVMARKQKSETVLQLMY
ncbi:unnamed protein product, partial [Choristocarpus tenellus]